MNKFETNFNDLEKIKLSLEQNINNISGNIHLLKKKENKVIISILLAIAAIVGISWTNFFVNPSDLSLLMPVISMYVSGFGGTVSICAVVSHFDKKIDNLDLEQRKSYNEITNIINKQKSILKNKQQTLSNTLNKTNSSKEDENLQKEHFYSQENSYFNFDEKLLEDENFVNDMGDIPPKR